jgi:putative aldouronate transport system permease protein
MQFSEVISTFTYRMGIKSMQFTIATAVGLFQSVVFGIPSFDKFHC